MRRVFVILLAIVLLLSVLACGLAEAYIGHTECYWARTCCESSGYCRTIAGDGSLCGPCPEGTLPEGECVVTCVNVTRRP